ncbi:hypothetical protein HanRHA438_Chr10g0466061 [Helianthus annuus]|nr:hypothetical protein HanHA89_Chr10g0394651 [Helianthus annuus]KAJ0697702.1 hypothetical protein HanLR1_Chr10g0372011 [Helianthus annuus]KAJ0701071.1 hypothetical protein HanOQP8_Chr10g0375371 [Helianthus annuus]KAJ0880689.1 hypothetical protein HanRHA438_Chr10g0466061 [Helianthus annuus]
MSIMSHGKGQTVKNFEDVDYPNLLQLPFPDQTYNIPKHLFSREIGPTTYEVSLEHLNHEHELILVDIEPIGPTSSKSSSLIMCHNPMKKIELLCNGCLRPIMERPFYKCGANEEEGCNFALHEWCARLPKKVENHPGHPYHPLTLMSNVPGLCFNIFHCKVCFLPCNGYGYGCAKCEYYVDVSCAFMPEKITHKSHPDHLLSIVRVIPLNDRCFMCLAYMTYDPLFNNDIPSRLGFGCSTCDVSCIYDL